MKDILNLNIHLFFHILQCFTLYLVSIAFTALLITDWPATNLILPSLHLK